MVKVILLGKVKKHSILQNMDDILIERKIAKKLDWKYPLSKQIDG
jgi:hypothetical protein